MCELPRANLGGKEVADHFRENLQPLHKARRIKKSEWNALALRGVENATSTERVADNLHNHRGGDPYMCGRAAFCGWLQFSSISRIASVEFVPVR